MEQGEFVEIRKRLGKTQKEMSRLLGVSLKGVKSFEQGWRKVPVHVERQMLFLLSRKEPPGQIGKNCWQIKKCSKKQKENCPAWEFQAGHLCWFISGTLCSGKVHQDWHEKMKLCRKCEVFKSMLPAIQEIDE